LRDTLKMFTDDATDSARHSPRTVPMDSGDSEIALFEVRL
jgi:hypothetical protein